MVAVLIGGIFASPAHAGYYSYFEWQQLDNSHQATYLAGAFDTWVVLVTILRPELASHVSDCVMRNKIVIVQLSRNVRAFAASQPDKQQFPVPAIMSDYLIQLCGEPSSN